MKKALSLLLALAMIFCLAVPALAYDDAPNVMGNRATELTVTPDNGIFSDDQYKVYTLNPYNEFANVETITSAHVIGSNTTITVSNNDTNKTSYAYVYLYEYSPNIYNENIEVLLNPTEDYINVYGELISSLPMYLSDDPSSDWFASAVTTNSGKYWCSTAFSDDNTTRLYSGESVTFDLPHNNPDSIYKLYVEIYYPEYDYSFWKWDAFVVDDDAQFAPVETVGAFTDVKADAYYASAVKWGVDNGIVYGTSTTEFSPEVTCTNAQILSYMWRAAGSPEPTIANPFSDVQGDEYYAKAAIWAYEKGMVSGTQFGAKTDCTRAMTMEYFWKQAGCPATDKTDQFTDVPADASYAEAVAWANANGITFGTSDTTFSPSNTCTRAQIVSYLFRAVGK